MEMCGALKWLKYTYTIQDVFLYNDHWPEEISASMKVSFEIGSNEAFFCLSQIKLSSGFIACLFHEMIKSAKYGIAIITLELYNDLSDSLINCLHYLSPTSCCYTYIYTKHLDS